MVQSLIGGEAVRGARGLRFEKSVLQPALAVAAPRIAAISREREREGEGEGKGEEEIVTSLNLYSIYLCKNVDFQKNLGGV